MATAKKKNPYAPWQTIGRKVQAMAAVPNVESTAQNPYASWQTIGQKVAAASAAVPFHPLNPTPPAGTYDPTLDINLAATQRGYGDLQTDIGTAQTRGTTDYLTGKAGIAQGASRGYADLGTQATQEGQNYQANTANLARDYGILAGRQLEGANAAGALEGGALAQSAAKRTANQAHDQSPLDVAHQRALDAFATANTRLGQDSGFDASGNALSDLPLTSQLAQLNLTSAPPDASNPLGGRSWQDWTTQLQRAGRETTQAGIDTSTVKGAEATAAGWNPPAMPKNEFVGPDGKHYQTHVVGNQVFTVDQAGRVVSRKKRKG